MNTTQHYRYGGHFSVILAPFTNMVDSLTYTLQVTYKLNTLDCITNEHHPVPLLHFYLIWKWLHVFRLIHPLTYLKTYTHNSNNF